MEDDDSVSLSPSMSPVLDPTDSDTEPPALDSVKAARAELHGLKSAREYAQAIISSNHDRRTEEKAAVHMQAAARRWLCKFAGTRGSSGRASGLVAELVGVFEKPSSPPPMLSPRESGFLQTLERSHSSPTIKPPLAISVDDALAATEDSPQKGGSGGRPSPVRKRA
eukprot:1246372-Prymnesium_polylepis.1